MFFLSPEEAPEICCQDQESIGPHKQALESTCCWVQMGAMQDLIADCTDFFTGERSEEGGSLKASFPVCFPSYVFIFLFIHAII